MNVRRSLTSALLIFDADNTLWDTNAVFLGAQVAMLRPIVDHVSSLYPEAEVPTLRRVDRLLFQRLGKFEYDFRLLAVALVHHYLKECPIEDAACRAIEGSCSGFTAEELTLVDQAHGDYVSALQEIPPLLPDTRQVLSLLHEARCHGVGLALTLFSEGDPDRLGRILAAHDLAGDILFQATHIGPKSPESFELFREVGQSFLDLTDRAHSMTLVVGDSLRREIQCGNRIGATTIYIPAEFMGVEQPADPNEKPDYCLARLGELPALLRDLNLI